MFLVRGTDSKTSLPNTANNAPVRLTEPVRNQIVTSPLNIRGDALGTWFFEANMPVKLVDSEGKVLAQVGAMAVGEWMTTDYVPFTAKLEFTTPTANAGYLIFEKDNPSGLPQLGDEYKVGVRFR